MTPQATTLILTIEGEGVSEDWLVVGWEHQFGGNYPVGVKLGEGEMVSAQVIMPTGKFKVKYLL